MVATYPETRPVAPVGQHFCSFCGAGLATWQNACPKCGTLRGAVEPTPPHPAWITWRRSAAFSAILGGIFAVLGAATMEDATGYEVEGALIGLALLYFVLAFAACALLLGLERLIRRLA